MTFTARPLSELNIHDVAQLCEDATPEGEMLEFKSGLSSKRGDDPWSDRRNLTDRARNAILREVIAFANAHGGRIVLGIEETKDKPPRAASLSPLIDHHELAERLQHAARDVVEPQIPLIRIRGIDNGAAGEKGVVIIDVPESPLAPHRLMADWRCFVRRADRSENMTMREIQDLTIDRLRGSARAEAHLNRVVSLFPIVDHNRYFIRFAAVPTTGKISLPWNIDLNTITPKIDQFTARQGSGDIPIAIPVRGLSQPRSILRGWMWPEAQNDPSLIVSVFWDGGVTFQFEVMQVDTSWQVYPEWIVALAANTLLEIDRIRLAAEQPEIEYALKFQLDTSQTLSLLRYGGKSSLRGVDTLRTLHPPVYGVGARESFPSTIDIIHRDLFNEAGVSAPDLETNIPDGL